MRDSWGCRPSLATLCGGGDQGAGANTTKFTFYPGTVKGMASILLGTTPQPCIKSGS